MGEMGDSASGQASHALGRRGDEAGLWRGIKGSPREFGGDKRAGGRREAGRTPRRAEASRHGGERRLVAGDSRGDEEAQIRSKEEGPGGGFTRPAHTPSAPTASAFAGKGESGVPFHKVGLRHEHLLHEQAPPQERPQLARWQKQQQARNEERYTLGRGLPEQRKLPKDATEPASAGRRAKVRPRTPTSSTPPPPAFILHAEAVLRWLGVEDVSPEVLRRAKLDLREEEVVRHFGGEKVKTETEVQRYRGMCEGEGST